MNILETQVSYYKGFKDTVGVTTTLNALLTRPRPDHKRLLERIRAISDKAERDTLKKILPLFSPSALLSNRNADVPLHEKLISYSGFMQFDIDGKENPGMNPVEVRDAMARIPFLAYVALSASGRGVWGLIRIEQPERLAEHYAQFKKIVHEKTGIKLDTSKGGNPTDLRFISYDPDAKLNLSAIPLKLRVENKSKRVQSNQVGYNKGTADLTRGDVDVLVNEIVQRRINLFSDYKTWFAVGTGFIKEFGSDGLEPFQAISQFYPTYDYDDTEKQYNSWVKSNTISGSIGTFFNVCKGYNLYAKDLIPRPPFIPPKKPQEPPKYSKPTTTSQPQKELQKAPEPTPTPTSTTDVLESFYSYEASPGTPSTVIPEKSLYYAIHDYHRATHHTTPETASKEIVSILQDLLNHQPIKPIKLDHATRITNVGRFVKTGIEIAEANAGNKAYYPYIERLIMLAGRFDQSEPEPLAPGVHSLTNRHGVTFDIEINEDGYPTIFDT